MLAALSACFFFFNDTATTEIYTLSLHDALPISCSAHRHGPGRAHGGRRSRRRAARATAGWRISATGDRKSTRLNSSHSQISYAVFCLKKKKLNPADRERHAQTRYDEHDLDVYDP